MAGQWQFDGRWQLVEELPDFRLSHVTHVSY